MARRVAFIDSALEEEIKSALDIGFQGVTTNPSLIAKAPREKENLSFIDKYIAHMCKIRDVCNKYRDKNGENISLSVEVFSLDSAEMINQARTIKSALNYDNLAIKIPVSYRDNNYLGVIKKLADEGFLVNATCGATTQQLEFAAQSGARFVSLFFNRIIDDVRDKMVYADTEMLKETAHGLAYEKVLKDLAELRSYLDNNIFNSEIILGSIRNHIDVRLGWKYGADIVTTGLKVMPDIMKNLKTDEWVEGFDRDLKKWMG